VANADAQQRIRSTKTKREKGDCQILKMEMVEGGDFGGE
jgi:hypothetical protein